MFGNHKECEKQLAQAHAQISDLMDALIQVQRQAAEERRELLDRLLALSNPGVLREVMVTRMPRKEPQPNEKKTEEKLFTPLPNPAAFKPTEAS